MHFHVLLAYFSPAGKRAGAADGQHLTGIEAHGPRKRTRRFFMLFAFLSAPRERGRAACF
ncbi:hypothetical protein AYM40_10865 [Paraburkholderia phytofirmans OLGA172]|uniref:Uncharacterized protein n=1 Tax=Paraburkholderia phytofirmans OLGA172 TaxID=1417228 RepID=A0A160FKC3_9BURK|nr:hypothetical protein AYM40_10865 [Paraburkholderia phytofirmans OLGA172]